MAVHITINGKEIETEEGKTILEAARENGIYIPTLCYHSHLHPIGSCRLCIVDIEGYPMPMAACTTPVMEGIKVHTNTGRVQKMRRQAMELILVNHPLDCPVCDKGGECRLQDLAYEFGIDEQPFHAKKPERDHVPFSTPLIRQWYDRCVLCLRCVHVCHELVGNAAIDIKETGYRSVIYPVAPERCSSCGECLSVCPVGALTEAVNPLRGRVWQVERTQTTCGQCGVGCQLEISAYENKPINVKTDGVVGQEPNFGSLCVRGRFFYDYVSHEDRVVKPKVKKGAEWVSLEWNEAYEEVINHLREVLDKNGPESVGIVASARLTNEDLLGLYEFAGKGLGISNVDVSSRLDLAPQLEAAKALKANGAVGSPASLKDSDVVIVVGGDLDQEAQVLANQVRYAQRMNDAKVITINPYKTRLSEISDASILCNAGTEIPVFYGLLKEALAGAPELEDKAEWKEFSKNLEDYAADAVCEAAQIDGGMFETAKDILAESASVAFVLGYGLGQSENGSENIKALANLALACQGAGKKVTWIAASAYANGLGALWINEAMDTPDSGLTYGEMIQAAHDGALKALILVEEDPLASLPNTAYVREALDNLDFLLVVDLFETEAAKHARLFLPSCSFMEKSGTFVNIEGDFKEVRQILEPLGGAKAVWEIFGDIAEKMKLDVALGYESLIERSREIRENGNGLKQEFFDVKYEAVRAEANGHLFLIPSGLHFNHHYGGPDVHAMAIEKLGKQPEYLMNPKDAVRMGVEEGQEVIVKTSKGALKITPVFSDGVKEGHLIVKCHYRATGLQDLYPFELDEESKTPIMGFVRVKMEKP